MANQNQPVNPLNPLAVPPPPNAVANIANANIANPIGNNIIDDGANIPFNNNLNINDINNNILNNGPHHFLQGDSIIIFSENGVNRRVPFISPMNWENYININVNNLSTIRINYEFWILHLFGEREIYNREFRQMEAANADRHILGFHNMNRLVQIMDIIDDDIVRFGNIFLGIIQRN